MKEVAPIELTLSDDLKKYLEFIAYCEKLWEEEVNKMMITSDKLGVPKPR